MKKILPSIKTLLYLTCIGVTVYLIVYTYHYKTLNSSTKTPHTTIKTATKSPQIKQAGKPVAVIIKTPAHSKKKVKNDSTDISAQILALNNKRSAAFNQQFPSGTVLKGSLQNYYTKTEYGYILNMQTTTPISTPAIVDDRVYTSGGFGSKNYYSFNYQTGKLAWADNMSDDGPSPAVYSDSALFINTESCTLFAINRFNGEMMWSHWLGDPLLSTPVVSENKVYTSYPAMAASAENTKNKRVLASHAFACFNAKTGSVLWQKWLDGDVLVSPVIDGSYVYMTTFPGTVYKLDKNNGNILACNPLKATSTPTVLDDRIYITHRSDNGKDVGESIVELEKETLKLTKEFTRVEAPYLDYEVQKNTSLKNDANELDAGNGFAGGAPAASGWEKASKNIGQSNVASLQFFQPSVVLINNKQIISLMGKTIYCIDPDTRSIIWQKQIDGDIYKVGGSLATAPLLVAGHLVTVTYNGKLLVINANTGTIELEKNFNRKISSAPVVKKGFVFIPSASGDLLAVNTHMEELDGWPMFMKNPQHNIR